MKQRISVATALFNPSWYLAGGWSLGIGLALILLTGFIASFASGHVDGVLDLHFGRPAPLWLHLAEGVVDWLALSLLLYVAGRMLSRSHHLRALDVFGTQARAQQLHAGETPTPLSFAQPGQDGPYIIFLGITIFNLLMLVWMVALMYRAYAASCNLKGVRAAASFVIVIIIAEFLAKIGVQALFIVSGN